MKEYALKYAELGYSILPLQENGKAPMTTDKFSSGFKTATKDKQLILDHWEKYPNSNIGLKINKNLLILDIDVHDVNGFDSLETLVAHFGELPDTFTVTTPTGGRHYYFQLPDGVVVDRQINLFKGIDILTNGYVVAVPSCTDKGKYKVLSGSITQLATCPAWLLDAFKTHKEQERVMNNVQQSFNNQGKKYTGLFLDELVKGAEPGGRNEWIMRMTSKMLAVGADLETIYSLLLVANEHFLSEPLPLQEINATFKSRVKKHTKGGH